MPREKIEILKEKLLKLYNKENMTIKEISNHLDVSRPTIINRFKEYNIETKTKFIRNINITKEKLEELYNEKGLTIKRIAKIYNVSQPAVSKWCKKFDIETRGNKEGSKEKRIDVSENKLKKLYEEKGMTQEEIADFLDVSNWLIKQRIKDYDINTGYSYKNVNEEYFEEINTKTKTYWIGFITGDGKIGRKNLSINLGKKDREHLEKFKEDIESEHKISNIESNDAVHLSISRKKIAKDLKELGLPKDKSHKNIPMLDVPDKFMNHFIRGLFDADGCIRFMDNYGQEFNITGSEKMIKQVNDILGDVVGKTNTIEYYNNTANTIVIHFYASEDVEKIYHYLYDDAERWLDRKRNKFEEILDI